MSHAKRYAALALFALAGVGVATLSLGGKAFASISAEMAGYRCDLPNDYSELDEAVEYATDTRQENPFLLRGTVTLCEAGAFYLQRVNQATGHYDALEVRSSADVSSEMIVDLFLGDLVLEDGHAVLIDPEVTVVYDQTPFELSPTEVGGSDYEALRDGPAYLSRYVTIKNLCLDESSSLVTADGRVEGCLFNSAERGTFALKGSLCSPTGLGLSMLKSQLTSFRDGRRAFHATGVFTSGPDGDHFRVFSLLDAGSIDAFNPIEFHHQGNVYIDAEANVFTTMSLYRVKDHGDIDYVSFAEAYAVYETLVYGGYRTIDEVSLPRQGVYHFPLTEDGSYYYEVDADADTLFFSDYDLLFNANRIQQGDAYIATGYEVSLVRIKTSETRTVYPESFEYTLDFAPYGIDFVGYGQQVYVPVSTFLSVFYNANRIPFLYNGSDLFYGGVLSKKYLNQDSDNALDNVFYDGAFATVYTRESHFAEYNYAQLCFDLDHFYGLKEHFGVGDYNSFLAERGYAERLRSVDVATAEEALMDFSGEILYEGHSSLAKMSPCDEVNGNASYYYNRRSSALVDNEYRNRLSATYQELDERRAYAGCSTTAARFYEDMAVFPFNKFVKMANTEGMDPMAYSAAVWEENDTYMLFRRYFAELADYEAHERKVNSIVIDNSLNGGGMVDAMPFMLAFFCEDPTLMYRNVVTGEATEIHYVIDLDRDGVFGDTYAGQYDFYLLDSNYSFSCGNAFPTFVDRSSVTVIGETSGGGSCVVGSIVTATGTYFTSSSPMQFGWLDGNNFTDNENGAPADYALPRSSFYDNAALYNFIQSIN